MSRLRRDLQKLVADIKAGQIMDVQQALYKVEGMVAKIGKFLDIHFTVALKAQQISTTPCTI